MSRIKELREALGIKQEEIAMLCGVTQSTVSLWEIGKTVPRKKALETLANRFGVSAGYLLGIENDESAPNPDDAAPRTPEARIVSGWMDDLPQDVRKQIQTIVQAAIANSPELLRRKDDADAEHS